MAAANAPIVLSRRDVLKGGTAGLAALVVSPMLPGLAGNPAYGAAAQAQALVFTITDVLKNMVTHQDPQLNRRANIAQCYFWTYQLANVPIETPGPIIFAREGDLIDISVTNALDENHELAIPGIGFTTGPIAPGASFAGQIAVPANAAGTYLYFDTLNAPVNRMMGLHGAFVVMPNPDNGTPFTAADVAANPKLAQLFADLGAQPWWPGLAWNEGAANDAPFPPTPPFRQVIWLLHEASPNLFAEVGQFPPGQDFPAATFVDRFLNNSFVPNGKNKAPAVPGDHPQYFTISGQSGHFSHNTPFVTPFMRVGEPNLVRVLNAGLWTHCIHLHANHFYMLKVRNELTNFGNVPGQPINVFLDLDPAVVPGITDNHIWLDVFGAHPGDVYEYIQPYMRPPDVPNATGNGRADLGAPLPVNSPPIPNFGAQIDARGRLRKGPTPAGVTTWPPIQELNFNIPEAGRTLGPLLDAAGNVIVKKTPVHMPLSPLCFPMHDHSEPTQTAQGGNYNQGLIAGIMFIGDRNANGQLDVMDGLGGLRVGAGGEITFPMAPITFDDPNFPTIGANDAAANERAVYGADTNQPVLPPAGPIPPYEEAAEGPM